MSSAAPPPPPAGYGTVRPARLSSVREQALAGERHRRVVATGFAALDRAMAGGLRTQNLTVIGGRPGVGKTITMLQWARTMARAGETVVVACYEHDERTLMDRLLLMELGDLADSWAERDVQRGADALADASGGRQSFAEAVDGSPALAAACESMADYEDRLLLVRADGATTTVDELGAMVAEHDATIVMVDYVQKVPTHPYHADDRLRVMAVAQALKDLAMRADVAVVAVAIASSAGLEAQRLRLQHLDGSSTLTYESDAVLLLNTKYDIVHRNHIVYDQEKARDHKRWVVFSIEKHRDGPESVDLQFRKDFRHYRFVPDGGAVVEKLVDERHDA